jgi:putative ABC transport system substrate-binding protein
MAEAKDGMRRRRFLAAIGGAAASWPFAAAAQRSLPRIGFLGLGGVASIDSARQVATIKQGFADNGLAEGRDYIFEPRFAAGSYDHLTELTRELGAAGVGVVLANAIASVRAAERLVPPVPVVMISVDDPAGNGLVASLAKPGGHVTGTATAAAELTPKLLDIQRAMLPNAKSIALLHNPAGQTDTRFAKDFRARAAAAGFSVQEIAFASRNELEAAFRALSEPPDALHVMMDSTTSELADRIAALALARRLATFSNAPEFAGLGGLVACGPSREQLYRRSGYFVKKILDGADPADIPVELPARIELWVNPRTAAALDLTVPASLVAAADRIFR